MDRQRLPVRSHALRILTIGECLMVLPATVLLAASALRLLQPPRHEPARAAQAIFVWVGAHVSHLGAALVFIGMPGLAVLLGCATLPRIWREDATLRQDAEASIAILRRHTVVGLQTVATLLALAILLVVVVHIMTD